MKTYRYQATDADGRADAGVVEAADEAGARDRLAGRGLTSVTIEPARAARARRPPPLSEREAAELLEQLQGLTLAGLPLPSGLRAAAGELESPALCATFGRLADHLDAGRGLDAALVDEAGRFPAQFRGLVTAGARAGRLADVLGELVRSGNLGRELRRRVATAVAYPALVLAVVVFLVGFVCRISSRLVEDLPQVDPFSGGRTPQGAMVMVEVVRFIATYDVWALAIAAALALVAFLAGRFALTPAAARRWLESAPLVGPLLRFAALAEFCHLAALLVEAETPLPEAIDLAGASVRDPALAESCGAVALRVAEGEPLSAALHGWPGLPAALGQLLAWGEAQDHLGPALRFAGDMFESRAEAQATFAGQFLSAILLVLILWLIGFAVAAVYLPLQIAFRMIG